MSVTFTPTRDGKIDRDPALIAEMREHDVAMRILRDNKRWEEYDAREALLVACYERESRDDLNYNNGNAAALLRLLGLPDMTGEASIPTMRQAIMVARATFDRKAAQFTRPTVSSGHLVVDGVAHLDVPRFHSFGLDEDGLRSRLEQLASAVERWAQNGADGVTWG